MSGVRADLLVLARLLLAAALGGLVGWERLRAGKWVGIRTLMLIAVASALFTSEAGIALVEGPTLTQAVRGDPIRAIQAVSLGIGFLGAGIVHRDPEGGVQGLTTAAVAWATAALGVSIGLGRYALSVGTTALLLVILRLVAKLEPRTPPAR